MESIRVLQRYSCASWQQVIFARAWCTMSLMKMIVGTSVINGSGLPSCGPDWNWPGGPGPGQELARDPNRVTSAGVLPRPDINPRVFGQVGTRPWFHWTVLTTLIVLCLPVNDSVLIGTWHDWDVDCSVLAAPSPPEFRFAMQQMLVESRRNNAKFDAKLAGFW